MIKSGKKKVSLTLHTVPLCSPQLGSEIPGDRHGDLGRVLPRVLGERIVSCRAA